MVGLGKIGLPIATNLLQAGFTVTGYRRGDMSEFAALGGHKAASSADVAAASDVVLTCLPGADDLAEVVSGDTGIVSGARPELVVVELSTLSLETKERCRDSLAAAGAQMLDCPISGMPAMVTARTAVLLGSGLKETFDRCAPVFREFTGQTPYLGEFGAGSKMKFVANLLLAVHNLAAAEALALASKAGLDLGHVIEVIKPSIAGSMVFATRAPLMAERRYTPAPGPVAMMLKDLGVIEPFAESVGGTMPLLATATEYYRRAEAEGRAEQDIASLFSVLLEEAESQTGGSVKPKGAAP